MILSRPYSIFNCMSSLACLHQQRRECSDVFFVGRGPLQVFDDARSQSGEAAYRVFLVGEEGGPVKTGTAIPLPSQAFETVSAEPMNAAH